MAETLTDTPFLVALNLTRRCNLSCAHCYLDARVRKNGGAGALTTPAVTAGLDRIADTSDASTVGPAGWGAGPGGAFTGAFLSTDHETGANPRPPHQL